MKKRFVDGRCLGDCWRCLGDCGRCIDDCCFLDDCGRCLRDCCRCVDCCFFGDFGTCLRDCVVAALEGGWMDLRSEGSLVDLTDGP